MRPTAPGLRLPGLLALFVIGLIALEGLPRVRGRAEGAYELERLEQGTLLRARSVRGGMFDGALVLLYSGGPDGWTGLVLHGGRADEEPASEVRTGGRAPGDVGEIDGRAAAIEAGIPAERLGWGGPVGPESFWWLSEEPEDLSFLSSDEGVDPKEHASGEQSSVGEGDSWSEVIEGVWLIELQGVDEAIAVVESRPEAHIFVGRAAWAPGQLEREVMRGGWRVRQEVVSEHVVR